MSHDIAVIPLHDLFLRINQFAVQTPWLNEPIAGYAKYGVALFVVLMVIAWWIARMRGPAVMARAVLVPLATVGAVLAQQLVVALIAEPRPYAVYPDILVLLGRTTDPSFPSDHACVVGAVALALFFVDRRLGWLATVGALFMAAARVYAGVHWPLDVTVGLVLGAVVALLIELALVRPTSILVSWLSRTWMRPLLMAESASGGSGCAQVDLPTVETSPTGGLNT